MTLDQIGTLPTIEAKLDELRCYLAKHGRYVVFDSASDVNHAGFDGYTSLRAAQIARDSAWPDLDILDRQTQDIL